MFSHLSLVTRRAFYILRFDTKMHTTNRRGIKFDAGLVKVHYRKLYKIPEPFIASKSSELLSRFTCCHGVGAPDVINISGGEASDLIVKERKYVMVSGKGGVGKTSLSASLAVKYAEEGHDTLIVSTDPAHSLGDSLGQRLPGGKPVPIEGTDLPIWGMEIDPDRATAEFKEFAATGGRAKVEVRPCAY
jgi:hypothetical protein